METLSRLQQLPDPILAVDCYDDRYDRDYYPVRNDDSAHETSITVLDFVSVAVVHPDDRAAITRSRG